MPEAIQRAADEFANPELIDLEASQAPVELSPELVRVLDPVVRESNRKLIESEVSGLEFDLLANLPEVYGDGIQFFDIQGRPNASPYAQRIDGYLQMFRSISNSMYDHYGLTAAQAKEMFPKFANVGRLQRSRTDSAGTGVALEDLDLSRLLTTAPIVRESAEGQRLLKRLQRAEEVTSERGAVRVRREIRGSRPVFHAEARGEDGEWRALAGPTTRRAAVDTAFGQISRGDVSDPEQVVAAVLRALQDDNLADSQLDAALKLLRLIGPEGVQRAARAARAEGPETELAPTLRRVETKTRDRAAKRKAKQAAAEKAAPPRPEMTLDRMAEIYSAQGGIELREALSGVTNAGLRQIYKAEAIEAVALSKKNRGHLLNGLVRAAKKRSEEAQARAAQVEADAAKANEWLAEGEAAAKPAKPAEPDSPAFRGGVVEAYADAAQAGPFTGQKLIAEVWDVWRQRGGAATLTQFKAALIRDAKRRHITLGRLDMPGLLDKERVARSRAAWGADDEVHFIFAGPENGQGAPGGGFSPADRAADAELAGRPAPPATPEDLSEVGFLGMINRLRERPPEQLGPVIDELSTRDASTVRESARTVLGRSFRSKKAAIAALREDAASRSAGGETLQQTATLVDGERALGAFDRTTGEILLSPSADRSTFPHEFAHFALDWMGRASELPGASPELRADLEVVWRFLGVEGWRDLSLEAPDLPARRNALEKFARAHELYLREGRAPVLSLQRIFDLFSRWLKELYKTGEELDVRLTPEMRAFFDKLYTGAEDFYDRVEFAPGPPQTLTVPRNPDGAAGAVAARPPEQAEAAALDDAETLPTSEPEPAAPATPEEAETQEIIDELMPAPEGEAVEGQDLSAAAAPSGPSLEELSIPEGRKLAKFLNGITPALGVPIARVMASSSSVARHVGMSLIENYYSVRAAEKGMLEPSAETRIKREAGRYEAIRIAGIAAGVVELFPPHGPIPHRPRVDPRRVRTAPRGRIYG